MGIDTTATEGGKDRVMAQLIEIHLNGVRSKVLVDGLDISPHVNRIQFDVQAEDLHGLQRVIVHLLATELKITGKGTVELDDGTRLIGGTPPNSPN